MAEIIPFEPETGNAGVGNKIWTTSLQYLLNLIFVVMKKLLFVNFLFFLFFFGFSQSNITGKITDEKGNALIGANVILENTFYGTSTSLEGKFRFIDVKNGDYNLLVSYLGYNEFRKKISVLVDISVDITLSSSSEL